MKKFIRLVFCLLFIFSLVQVIGCDKGEEESTIAKVTGSISISPTTCELIEGESKEFNVETDIEGNVIWSISDMSVVSINTDGKKATIYAIKEGSSTITANILNKIATAQITVKADESQVSKVDFTTNIEAVSLYMGQIVKACGEIKTDGIKQNVSCDFVSNNQNVASVSDDGVITPVAIGETKIVVSCNYNNKTYSKEIFVVVRENIVLGLSETNIEINALTGDQFTTKDIDCVVYKNGEIINNASISWNSSNDDILQVDNNGTMTVQKAGSTCINAVYVEDEKEYIGSCLVTINHNIVNVETTNKIYVDLSEISGTTTEIELPNAMAGETIISAKNANDEDWQVNSNSLVLEKDKLVKGYTEYSFYSNVKEFVVSIYTANKVISSGDDFIDMLEDYTVSETIKVKDKKLFVLSQDINLNNTKRKNNQAFYYGYASQKYGGSNYFVDSFDGDGHMITSLDKNSTNANERYIWTNGLFAIMSNSIVKNLIVENALLSDNGSGMMGVIAQQVQGECTIENCVIINPTVKSLCSNFCAGMIAGRIYNTNNDYLNIKNNLVLDMQENPSFTYYWPDTNDTTTKKVYYSGENNCKYNGKVDCVTKNVLCNFYGAIGDTALSAKNTNIDDNYCLSANGYLNASNPNAVDGIWYEQERMPDGKVFASVQDLISAISSKIRKYTLLRIENGSLFIRDYELSVLGDNFGTFNEDWVVD